MSQQTGPSGFTIFWTSIAFILLISIVAFLDDSLFSRLVEASKKRSVIGKTIKNYGDTRKRLGGDVLWIPTRENGDVFDADSYFVGQNSSMQIKLKDSTQITISPDSMIKVDFKGKKPVLSLNRGSIKATGPDNQVIQVQMDGESIDVKLSSEEASIDRNSRANLEDSSENEPEKRELASENSKNIEEERKREALQVKLIFGFSILFVLVTGIAFGLEIYLSRKNKI